MHVHEVTLEVVMQDREPEILIEASTADKAKTENTLAHRRPRRNEEPLPNIAP